MFSWIVLVLVLVALVVGGYVGYLIAKLKFEYLFEEWKAKFEKRIRKDAISKSTNVLKGHVVERLAPFLWFSENGLDPRDARFLGDPVDYVVFDGLHNGELRRVVFVEVKAGKYARLSTGEKKIKRAIDDKRVEWLVLSSKKI